MEETVEARLIAVIEKTGKGFYDHE